MAISVSGAVNHRYIHANDNDTFEEIALPPISGYAKEQCLPLEEACEPLYTIVPNLADQIVIAKTNSKNPPDDLTEDESAAIHLYTMEWESKINGRAESLYVQLNRALKNRSEKNLLPWHRFLKLFLTGLVKLPILPPTTLWRGVRKDCSDAYQCESDTVWWGFSSCTSSLGVLESDLYLGTSGTRTLFSIETFNGRSIKNHSFFTTEDETLLLPGTSFKVISKLSPAPNMHIIHLRQIKPEYDLLEPPFEGAQLYPVILESNETRERTDTFTLLIDDNIKARTWYQNKIVCIGAVLTVLSIILVIIVGTVLGVERNNKESSRMSINFSSSAKKVINWSGYEWNVRNTLDGGNVDIGISRFIIDNVWVDSNKFLHLKMTHDSINDHWWCAEIGSLTNFSHGSFLFHVEGHPDQLDASTVFTMHTLNLTTDIPLFVTEFSKFGYTSATSPNLWFKIFPNASGTWLIESKTNIILSGSQTTIHIDWKNDSVKLEVQNGFNQNPNENTSFEYNVTLPSVPFSFQGPLPLHINLWLYRQHAPKNNKNTEIIVRNFTYTKY